MPRALLVLLAINANSTTSAQELLPPGTITLERKPTNFAEFEISRKESVENNRICRAASAKALVAASASDPNADNEDDVGLPGICVNRAPFLSEVANGRQERGSPKRFGWRNAADLPGGPKFVSELRHLATSRELTNCIDRQCLVAIPVTSDRKIRGSVEVFSLCEVQTVANISGPPTNCTEVARVYGKIELIRAELMNRRIATAFRFGAPDFETVFPLRNGATTASVVSLVKKALESAPFNLTVEVDDSKVIGIRRIGMSSIYPKWREWTTVIVDLRGFGSDLGVVISTTLLVSKQNAASRDAWMPASEAQESRYVDELKKELEKLGAVTTKSR